MPAGSIRCYNEQDQLWILNCAEGDTRTVGDCWDDGEHTHQQDEEKWTMGAQRNASHLGGDGRWIRAAIVANTGGLFTDLMGPVTGADKRKALPISRVLICFFWVTIKRSKTSECLPPALGEGRVCAHQESTLADWFQTIIGDRRNADVSLAQLDSEKRFSVQITVGQNRYLTF